MSSSSSLFTMNPMPPFLVVQRRCQRCVFAIIPGKARTATIDRPPCFFAKSLVDTACSVGFSSDGSTAIPRRYIQSCNPSPRLVAVPKILSPRFLTCCLLVPIPLLLSLLQARSSNFICPHPKDKFLRTQIASCKSCLAEQRRRSEQDPGLLEQGTWSSMKEGYSWQGRLRSLQHQMSKSANVIQCDGITSVSQNLMRH